MNPIPREMVLQTGEYLTTSEAARALGIGVQWLRVLIREGRVAITRQGRLIYLRRLDVEAGIPRKPRSGGRKARERPPKRRYTKRSEHWRNGVAQACMARAREGKVERSP